MNGAHKLAAAAAAVALIAAAPTLVAQEKKTEPAPRSERAEPYHPGHGPGYGMGPGMMGPGHHGMMEQARPYGPGPGPYCGTHPGMREGCPEAYGPWHGMGPGAMGGYGSHPHMGPGMMGGYGSHPHMGPGMMGGYGSHPHMGSGTMGGYGMGMTGPGAMGRMHLIWSLDLTDEQARRIERIHDELHRKQRGLMPQLWEAQDRLRDASAADERDPAAIGKAYAQVADVQRQMIESHVQSEQQMEAVLTPEQREQVKRGHQRGGRFGCPGY